MDSTAHQHAFCKAVHEQWLRSRVFNKIPRVHHTTPTGRCAVHIALVDMPAPDGSIQRFQTRYSPN
jgi:hypothetical protein